MSAKRVAIQCRGLVTDPSEFSNIGDGAMRTFTNWMLVRPNLMQSRRGMTRHATVGECINKLFNYETGQVLHTGSSNLRRLVSGSVTAYSPGFGITPNDTTKRIRGCIAGKNFYIAGPRPVRLSGIAGTPVFAGGIFSPGFDREALAFPAGTTLADDHAVAYRSLFGFTDAKGNRILGEVSGRLIAINESAATADITVRAIVPSEATTSHFIQIYRSSTVGLTVQPDDDLQLVYEKQLTALDITNKYVEITDICPESLRGEFIYTAPNAGEGIEATNLRPPSCVDICEFKNRTWFANTTQPGEFILQIIATGGSSGIQDTDTLVFGGLNAGFTITGKTGSPGANEYKIVTGGTASADIQATALNLVAAVNKHTGNSEIWAQYISSPDDVPGLMLFKGRTPNTGSFTILSGVKSKRGCFVPQTNPDLSGVSWSIQRVSGEVTATINSGTHNLVVGEQVLYSGGTGFTGGTFTITTVSGTTFRYLQAGIDAGPLAAQTFTVTPTDVSIAEVEALPNRVYFSKLGEYEATTADGWVDVGSPSTAILAVVPQRDQIWVFKTDGIYRILGSDETDFRGVEFDLTLVPVATETILKFRQRVWALTDRGVVAISEGGVEEMSKAIAVTIRQAIATYTATATLETSAFAVAYESEGTYALYVPDDRDLQNVAGSCKTAYVFQVGTETWSQFSYGSSNGKRCGIVSVVDRLLYFGDQYNGLAADSYIYKERKAFSAADLTDTTGANVDIGITKTATWWIQTADAPGSEKRWDELEFLFVSGQVDFSLVLANEENAPGSFTVTSQGTQIARVWPDVDVSRGSRLLVTVSHAVSAEAMELAGIAFTAEVLDGAATK